MQLDSLLTQPGPKDVTEDENSLDEAYALKNKIDLSSKEQLAAINRADRADRVDGHLHLITVCSVYLVSILCAIMFLSLVYNKIAPDKYRYLSGDDLSGIYQFLFTGTLGGLITGFGKRFLGK